MLSNENYDIVMATSTAALPAWMVKKYPETMSTDYEDASINLEPDTISVRTPWYIRSTQRLLRQSLQNAIAAIKIFLYGTSITSMADTATVTTARISFVYGSRISTRPLML